MVEVIIGANGLTPGNNAKTYFQDQPQLQSYRNNRTVYIKAIETFPNTALKSSPLTSLSPTAAPADITNATLTLTIAGTEDQQFIPLASMCRMWGDPANYSPWTWQPFIFTDIFAVDWTKCYVTTLDASAMTTPPFSYLFQVHYDYLPNT